MKDKTIRTSTLFSTAQLSNQPMDLLPDDVLAEVLRRLAPRSLAASRSVCKAWRAVVDAHRLLRSDILPLILAGIYVAYGVDVWAEYRRPTFFARPSIGDKIQGNLGYLDAVRDDWSWIGDHCNGLILLHEGVVNPATGQWASLPSYPDRTRVRGFGQFAFLAFDPTVSSHFEVFFMHCVLHRYANIDTELHSSGWPPSPFVMHAFSSKTWRWEERSFIREGTAVQSVADVEPFLRTVYHHTGVYRRGRLYVDHIYFIIRLSLEGNKFRVIPLPPMDEACGLIDPYLGNSEKGVYYGFKHGGGCKLQIWFLDESTDATEWTLKHKIDLKPLLASFPWKHGDGPWSVQGVSHEAIEKENPEWDSDNDEGTIATAAEVNVPSNFPGHICSILGFHPYREIVFLHTWSKRVLAYHLNSYKAEDLGSLPLDEDDEIRSSCTYTPCWMESCLSSSMY